MTAFDFVKEIRFLPTSTEGQKTERPSNSELKRWFEKGSVSINHKIASRNDIITYPLTELSFFKGSRKETTLWSIE